MIPGLKAGKFDVIMDGMAITDERKKEIDFSKPYAASPGSFLAPKDSPLAKTTGAGTLINLDKDPAAGEAAIKSVQAALKGKTLGVQVSTTHANFASQYLKDIATVKEYKTTDDRDLDLKSGRLDAVLEDLPTNMATASKPDASELAVVGPEFIGGVFGVGEGMGIRKSDADLTAKFDKALDGSDRRRVGQEIFRAVVQDRHDAPIRRFERALALKERAPGGRRSGRSGDLRLRQGRLGPGAPRGRGDDASRLRLRPPDRRGDRRLRRLGAALGEAARGRRGAGLCGAVPRPAGTAHRLFRLFRHIDASDRNGALLRSRGLRRGAGLRRGRARRRRHLGRLSGGSVPRRLSRHCARRARGRGQRRHESGADGSPHHRCRRSCASPCPDLAISGRWRSRIRR